MNHITVLFVSFSFCLSVISQSFAQDIKSKLAGDTNAQGFTVRNNGGAPLFTIRGDGKIGVGILNPDALLHLNGQIKITGGTPGAGKVLTSDANGLAAWATLSGGVTLDQAYDQGGAGAGRTITADAGAVAVAGVDGFLVTGTYGSGTIPASGAGTRMMFYPRKGAFRVGNVNGSQWDDSNIGNYSVALGVSTTASGACSFASGYSTTASGSYSTAMGYYTTASGYSSTAMGAYTTASARSSTAMGEGTIASGDYSTAMGFRTTASGDYSSAMGTYARTNSQEGSFVIGDKSTTSYLDANFPNKFRARFANGYDLFTNSAMTIGVYLNANGTSWVVTSDSTKKCNLALGQSEEILSRFSTLRLGSWNYIADQNLNDRHYGPMAQEWFAAFGHDGVGTIGNDTTLASADVDGVLCIAIKALEKRTRELKTTTAELKEKTEEITALQAKVKQLESERGEVQTLKTEVTSLRKMMQQILSSDHQSHAALVRTNENGDSK